MNLTNLTDTELAQLAGDLVQQMQYSHGLLEIVTVYGSIDCASVIKELVRRVLSRPQDCPF